MGVGSGIVWDSDAEDEYEECRLKARFLDNVVSEAADREPDGMKLIETMRWEEGGIELWMYHVERLRDSAAYFNYPFDSGQMRAAVEDRVATLDSNHPHKVRLTLNWRGNFTISAEPLDGPPDRPLRLTVADQRIDPYNPFRYHKTTRRQGYEDAYQQAQAAGCDEALLLNTRGEVAEGSRTNVFIETEGTLYTPPLSCGVLNGVYRRYLLSTRSEVSERILTLDDLHQAEVLYMTNAVRGMQQAELAVAAWSR